MCRVLHDESYNRNAERKNFLSPAACALSSVPLFRSAGVGPMSRLRRTPHTSFSSVTTTTLRSDLGMRYILDQTITCPSYLYESISSLHRKPERPVFGTNRSYLPVDSTRSPMRSKCPVNFNPAFDLCFEGVENPYRTVVRASSHQSPVAPRITTRRNQAAGRSHQA